jgi:L-rhamnose-H+ transport protein
VIFTHSTLIAGTLLAIVAGIMNGLFTLPMKYLGRWSWENVWALFIFISCIAMPAVIARITVPGLEKVLAISPAHSIVIACMAGFAWGFGAIMFGQGISAIGISMGNTLVLAISASLGSLLPILVLAPERLHHLQGILILCGTFIGVIGIVCCGYSGLLKERAQQSGPGVTRRQMVGNARPFGIGLLLCAGAGLLSAVFNIGYSVAQPVLAAAHRFGYSAFSGSNLIWLLMLTSGAVPNLCFCGYLFRKNGSWRKYALPGSGPLYLLSAVMGLLWGGNTFVYGLASPKLGRLGPAIGWPLTLIAGLITANIAGFMSGEWELTGMKERRWMLLGILVLLAAIAALGWSSALI